MGWISTHKSTLSSLPVCDDHCGAKVSKILTFHPFMYLIGPSSAFFVERILRKGDMHIIVLITSYFTLASIYFVDFEIERWKPVLFVAELKSVANKLVGEENPKNPMRTIEGKSEVYYRLTRFSNGLLMYGRLVFVANEVMERGKKGCSGSYCCNSTLT